MRSAGVRIFSLVVAFFLFFGIEPAFALRDGEGGWVAIWGVSGGGTYGSLSAACHAAYEAQGAPNGEFRGFIHTPAYSNYYFFQCSWSNFLDGCEGGFTTCPVVISTPAWFECKPGYHVVSGPFCEPDNERTPPRGPSCSSSGPESPSPNPVEGNPFVVFDGAKIEQATDYASADGKFSIRRFYRSLSYSNGFTPPQSFSSAAGLWRFDFSLELRLADDAASSAILSLPSGVSYVFNRSNNVFSLSPDSSPQARYSIELIGSTPGDWSNIGRSISQWRVTDRLENKIWTLQTFQGALLVARPLSSSQSGYVWNYSYDATGVLQTITDSFGRKFSFVWNYGLAKYGAPIVTVKVPTTIQSIGLPGGGKVSYVYDPPLNGPGALGWETRKLLSATVTDSAGRVLDSTSYHYEDPNDDRLLTGITDARGVRYATFAYDARGRAISTSHGKGQENYTISYSAPPQPGGPLVRTVTNPLGKQTVYTWSGDGAQGKLVSVAGQPSASCVGSTRGYDYDPQGFIARETDEEGRVTAYVRDANNRPTSITRGYGTPEAVTTTLTWHPTRNIATQIIEPGLTTNVTVDGSGRVTQIQKLDTTTQTAPYATVGETRIWTYSFNSRGLLTAVDGPLPGSGDTVAYSYKAGRLETITDEMGRVTTITNWNSRGQPTSVTDPNGVVTTLAYDPVRGLLTRMSVDAGAGGEAATTTIAYDPVGQITKITQPNGAFDRYVYDEARRLVTVTNAAGEIIRYTRNANGDATSTLIRRPDSSLAYTRTRAFDELGRLIRSIGARSQTYSFGYDKTNNLTNVTDPRSNVFSYGFDPLNRLISETDEEGQTVTLTRNGTDDIAAYRDARALTTTYVRNGFGDVIGEASPDRGTIVYRRDARGLVTQRTDARGVTTSFAYDAAGRLTGKTYSGSTAWAGFAWDTSAPDNKGVGRLVGASNESGVSSRAYDAKGRVWSETRANTPAPALTTQYAYDPAGNVTEMIYPSGRRVAYARDAVGRISGVTTRQNAAAAAQAVVANVQWNPYGPLAAMSFGYGGVAKFATDTDYRITRYQVGSVEDPGATIDRSLFWTGDMVDRIVDNKNPGTTPGQYGSQSQGFTYTKTRRLASARGYYGLLGWTYDANGNRLTETAKGVTSAYAYPATSNRLASVTPPGGTARTFGYDAAGDIVTDTRTGALGMSFEYDVEGRLSRAFQTNAPAQGARYGYDAFDRLASRTVTTGTSTTTTLYIHDLADHIIAETDTAGKTAREYIWLDDMPVAVVDGASSAAPTLYYVHADHLGRPARMMAQNGSTIWDVIYAPFGGTAWLSDATAKLDMRFPGQWFQLESGLAYNWHRHYDATLGRYVQPDPLRVDESEGETIGGLATSAVGANYLPSRSALLFNKSVVEPDRYMNRGNFPDGPAIYIYANLAPLQKSDFRGLSVTANGGASSSVRNDRDVCLRPESCTDHFVKCQESNNKKLFAPGYNCSSCHFYCTGIVANGAWPFQFCPY